MTDWQIYTFERRTKRIFTPARMPKKRNSIVALAKAWNVDKDRLIEAIYKINERKKI